MKSKEGIQIRHPHEPFRQEARPNLRNSRPESSITLLQKSDGVIAGIDSLLGLTKEPKRPSENAGTAAWVDYFDRNWAREGLPHDWYNLRTKNNKQVGFVMKNQMNLLNDPTNQESLEDWTQKTTRDLEGFKLEFLSNHNVYPRAYRRNPFDPTRLEDPLYGKTKNGRFHDITEIISDEERKGSVKESLSEAKEFLLNSPEGSIAVMTSPLGPTGFVNQDGRGIDYKDTYFFVMVNFGDTVMNYTIKTDFKLPQVRGAIQELTGRALSPDAPLEEYVRSIAKIKPGTADGIQNVFDAVSIFEQIQPGHAFKDPEGNQETRSWQNVYDDIVAGEDLYEFDTRTTRRIDEFGKFARAGKHTAEDLQKGSAATILLMSDLFFAASGKKAGEVILEEGAMQELRESAPESMGEILEKTAEIRGCSGGGGSNDVFFGSLIPRFTLPGGGGGGSREWFTCPKCPYKADGPIGNMCPGCGITKEQFAKDSGEPICD